MNSKTRRKIAVLTGSRGEWGYLRPILRLIQKEPKLEYAIIATHMHLLPEFGMSINQIENDGFEVAERLLMTLDGYTAATMTKSLAILLLELPTVLQRLNPDILLLAGDRGEQLMGAIAGLHMSIPVAHIQAGELSGNVDGVVRHAITKLAHIHFAANQEFADRVKFLGEQEFRIFATGAPLVDELVGGYITPITEVRKQYHLPAEGPFILAVQHPVTEEEAYTGDHIKETIQAINDTGLPTIIVYPNADAGSEIIRSTLHKFKHPNMHLVRNLPRQDYVGLMKSASVLVGNSSSGIMEAPSFGTPTVNIGRRQIGRLQAGNVINVQHNREEILGGIKKALTPEFREIAKRVTNPYGDGHASERIVDILATIEINDRLLNKELTF